MERVVLLYEGGMKVKLDIDKLYEKYFNKVFFYSKRILKDIGTNEDVEECVSDVFLSIWKDLSKYDNSRGSIDTYINVKTRSIALNYRKKLMSKAVKRYVENLDDFNIKENDNLNTENKVIDKLNEKEILDKIKGFREPDKTYFYLRYFMNYDIKTIAKMFDTTISAVDNRLYRCRLNLKKAIKMEVV